MKEVEKLPLKDFTRYCMSISQVPASYLAGLTMEEQLLWLCSFLTNEVIPTVNNNAEDVEELQQLYIQLKDYVDNYFDNLDIQEEVNTKLEEMAQSGELAELIAQYLEAQAVIGFNTCSGLAAAENLADGSFARTMGRNSYNDGYGAFYKIRERLNADVPDGYNIIVLTNTENLVAERIVSQTEKDVEVIIDGPLNVKLYGVKGDGITDDTQAIQDCIDNNPHTTLYFPTGTYLISEPISIKKGNEYQVNLTFDEDAVIKTDTQINALIEIGLDTTGSYDRYSPYGKMTIQGGTWDATNTTYGIYITSSRKFTILKDLYIINVANYGVYLDRSANESVSTDARLFNVTISGNGPDVNSNAVGLYAYGTDNEMDNLRINRIAKGMYMKSGGDLITNTHITNSWNNPSAVTYAEYNNTIAVDIESIGPFYFTNLYCDTYGQSLVINNESAKVFIDNFETYYWLQKDGLITSMIKFLKYPITGMVKIDGLNLNPPTLGAVKGIDTDSLPANDTEYFAMRGKVQLYNVRTSNQYYNDDDLIKCLQVINESTYNLQPYPWTKTMQQNAYYRLALLKSGQYNIDVRMANDQLINVIVNVGPSGNIQVRNIKSNSHVGEYTIALVNGFTRPNGLYYAGLAVKASTSTCSLNPTIDRITPSYTNQMFKSKDVFDELVNPTIIASASFNP